MRLLAQARNDAVSNYRSKKPGTDADRPTLPGGRGIPPGARGGGGCRGAAPKPKKLRKAGVPD
jgi:hypothetical protein